MRSPARPASDAAVRVFMRAWYRSRESDLATVPFPVDAPVARVPGPEQLRVLLVGNGAASGWGVRSHDLALTGRLARALADLTGRGTHVDASVDRLTRLSGVGRLLAEVDLSRYDAIVLFAGMNDAVNLVALDAWAHDMRRLLDRFRVEAPRAAVLVLGPQSVPSVRTYQGWPSRIAERHRGRMNDLTAALCAQRDLGFAILPEPERSADASGHRSPEVYRRWASRIAESLAPLLQHDGHEDPAQSEEDRQRATTAMLPDADPDPGLDRVTRLARDTFGADFAAVSMIDGEWQKNRSVAGAELTLLPRASSMCDHTIRSDRPLVVADLSKDPRFVRNPAVAGSAHLRFYAGYPIESPDGYRIGALCVLGVEPRDPAEIDTALLADLAMLAQKELWASVDRAADGGGAPSRDRVDADRRG